MVAHWSSLRRLISRVASFEATRRLVPIEDQSHRPLPCLTQRHLSYALPRSQVGNGGGAYIDESVVTFTTCEFEENKADVRANPPSPSSHRLTFPATPHVAPSPHQTDDFEGLQCYGGGTFIQSSEAMFTGCKFKGNRAKVSANPMPSVPSLAYPHSRVSFCRTDVFRLPTLSATPPFPAPSLSELWRGCKGP